MRTWSRFVVWFDKLGKIGAFSEFIPHFGISLNHAEKVGLLLKKIYVNNRFDCRQMLRIRGV